MMTLILPKNNLSIEGIPFIIRFKTFMHLLKNALLCESIEGIPFIIRFKTPNDLILLTVLSPY